LLPIEASAWSMTFIVVLVGAVVAGVASCIASVFAGVIEAQIESCTKLAARSGAQQVWGTLNGCSRRSRAAGASPAC
jgi:hypothetical protein